LALRLSSPQAILKGMKRPLYLVDSYAFIYRSYFAFLSRPLRNAAGENVSAVFGFFRFLFNLFDEHKPGAFAAVFDSRGPTFRHEMYDAYKATRQKTPDDLHAQVPLVEEILDALGVPRIRAEGFEADDLIATLATRCKAEGRECWIVSGDKDLLQLVGGPVKALRPDSSFAFKAYGVEEVEAEWGVTPPRILDYLSLTGDASDNIPGVPGIGDKTAVKLLAQFPTLGDIYAHLDEVKPESLRKKLEAGRELAELSHRLVILREDVPLPFAGMEALELEGINRRAANPLFMREGMKSLIATAKEAGIGGSENDGQGAGELFAPEARPKEAGSGDIDGETQTGAGSAPAGASRTTRPELLGEGSYETLTDPTRLAAWVDGCLAAGVFAFDCETDSLDELHADPVGFSLSYELKKACYVPLRAPAGDLVMAEADAKRELARLFASSSCMLVGQNVKYDYSVMRRFVGAMKNPLYDTMIASWLLDAEADSLGLEALAERRLGYRGIEYNDLVPKGKCFADVPLELAGKYAAEDADLTLRLYSLTLAELEEAKLLPIFRDLEMPLVPILAGMEAEGIRVEAPELKAFGAELETRLGLLEREIWGLVGHEFNIASTKQLQEVLFVERKLPSGKKTKTGFSTDTSVLEELAALDPVPDKILKRRSLAKLKSTYVDALVDLVQGEAQGDLLATKVWEGKRSRIHTHYLQTGTATGRISSRDPNLQNIPIRDEEGRRIRAAFVADEGSLLVSADYAQIELVVLAHLSGDPGLTKAFRDGVDVHRRTAALLFKLEEAAVTSEQRRIAKTINFGVIYGMSAFRLANELRIPRGEAQSFIDAYFATYSGVRDFINKTVAETERTGYATTLFGRRRPILMINSRNKTEKQAAERVAVNTPIQGSAADIVKKAMIAVDRALKAETPAAHLLLQVHDELIVETPAASAEAVAALVKREMEGAVTLDLPLRASVEIARSWGEMH
jgi:DNA polymerase-1